MILPTVAVAGHYANYGLAVAKAGSERRWTIDVATPVTGLNHPAGIELARIVHSTGGELVDIPSEKSPSIGFAKYAEGQLRRWTLVREAGLRAQKLRQHDLVYVDGGDGWYLPCSMLGLPIARVPIITIMLRTRYHHGSLGYGASYKVRGAFAQRSFMESFLKCRSLAAVLTPDRSWADRCSHLDQTVNKKVRYVPDMGATISRVNQAQAKKELGIDPEKRLVLCLGRLDDRKGLIELLAAVCDQACPASVGVLLMGQWGGLTALPGLEFASALKVERRLWMHEGAYSADQLACALSAADAVWLGYRNHPFSSGVLWEAAQAGVPILGCDRGLIALEIRLHDLGETVNIADTKAVALAIKRIMTDDLARTRWRENGLRAGAEHTAERFGEAAVTAMEETCGANQVR